jgi:PhzF family phenazine biosynthesis protein
VPGDAAKGCDDAAVDVLRYTAFSDRPSGGNPAGVVLHGGGLSDERMLAIAAEVGYSETAFLVGGDDAGRDVRYFSPLAEVPFCGHATVATAVALAEREGPGELLLRTRSGPVRVTTRRDDLGRLTATLTSVAPWVEEVDAADVDEALAALGWERDELDPALPARVAFAGARHLVLAAASRERLAALDYDFQRLGDLMRARDWTTVQLVWGEQEGRFHARNPFPVGGVVEDPATGAAAAAFGAYLRELGLVTPPATITILQGEDLGRPSRLLVDIHADRPEIDVTGTAVAIG